MRGFVAEVFKSIVGGSKYTISSELYSDIFTSPVLQLTRFEIETGLQCR